ncbi:MAG: AmmeMemoRadiSam system radical SAM enzyme, partial [Candidatus Thorarchaeota archaeon]
LAKSLGVHIEVISLVIPGVNDNEAFLQAFARRVLSDLGVDTPVHFTRYFPAYEFTTPSTPIKTLEKARDLALEVGLRYSYLGNVPGHPYENTYCPACGQLLLRRYGSSLVDNVLTSDHSCPQCGERISLVLSEDRQS